MEMEQSFDYSKRPNCLSKETHDLVIEMYNKKNGECPKLLAIKHLKQEMQPFYDDNSSFGGLKWCKEYIEYWVNNPIVVKPKRILKPKSIEYQQPANLDLTKILQVGDVVWSYLHGWVKITDIYTCVDSSYPIVFSYGKGRFTDDACSGGRRCIEHINSILFPSPTERDWSKFKRLDIYNKTFTTDVSTISIEVQAENIDDSHKQMKASLLKAIALLKTEMTQLEKFNP